jgi:membrane-associated phospholipid phosphatase
MSVPRLILALALFAVITVFAVLPASARFDRQAAVWIQRAAPAADVPTAVLVFLADAEVVGPGLLIAGIILLIRRDRRGWTLLWLDVAAVGVSLTALVLKHVIVHPGPPPDLIRHIGRPGLTITDTPFGYPSGHTMRTTLLAGTLLRGAPMAAAALVVAMMASLVYLGDHWTTEVLGGLCLGWACVELVRGLAARFRLG